MKENEFYEDNPINEPEPALYKAEGEDRGKRVDVYLTEKSEGKTRSFIQKLIENGKVTLNGNQVKTNTKLKQGDEISVEFPAPEILSVVPMDIPLDIVYEDSDIIIINKKRGMTVHPAPGTPDGTLVNALLYRCTDLSDINGVIRPGIVHRIDKDTTGLIAVAKNNKAHLCLAGQLADHSMRREYLAICEGVIAENTATIDAPIGRHKTDRKKMSVNTENGRDAVTHIVVLERFAKSTMVKCILETGRTHQIRVHLAYIGHPVAGDPLYGNKVKRDIEGQALHAYKLTLTHPGTGELMTFEAPPPEDFNNLLETVRKEEKKK